MSNQKQQIYIEPNSAVSIPEVQLKEGEPVRLLSKLSVDDRDTIIFDLKHLEDRDSALADKVRQLHYELEDLSINSKPDDIPKEDVDLVKCMFQKLAWENMENQTDKS